MAAALRGLKPMRAITLYTLAAVVAVSIWISERVAVPPPKDYRVHITYWEKWTGFEGDAIRAVVDAFNRSQDRIHVDLLTVSGIQNKLLLATAGGTPPDVAGLWSYLVPQYVDARALTPLDERCARAGIGPEDYVPVYWRAGVYRGAIYALPTTPGSTALHYNRALFREVGLDPDRPPRTIEELDAFAEKLTKKRPDGKMVRVGFMHAEPGWWHWAWGYMFGGRLWDGRDRLTLNCPENLRAYEWIASYSRKYGARNLQTFKSGLGTLFASPENGFLCGKVAMEIQGVWMHNFISKYAPQMTKPTLQWAAAPFPYPADRPDLAGGTMTEADCVVIPRGARHPDEAFEFIRFLESQKGMELLCLLQGKHTPLSRVSPEFYARHPNPYIKLFYELPRNRTAFAVPPIGIWPELRDALTAVFEEVLLEQKTPKQALDDVQARMQPKFEEYLRRIRLREQAEGRTHRGR